MKRVDDLTEVMLDFYRRTIASIEPVKPPEPIKIDVSTQKFDPPRRREQVQEEPKTPRENKGLGKRATDYVLTSNGQNVSIYNGESIWLQLYMSISIDTDQVFSDDVFITTLSNQWLIINPNRPTLHITGPSVSLYFNQSTWVPPIYPNSLPVTVNAFSPFYQPMAADIVGFDIFYQILHATNPQVVAENIRVVGTSWIVSADPTIAHESFGGLVVP